MTPRPSRLLPPFVLPLLLVAGLTTPAARGQTPPTPDATWNNFVGGTTTWTTANNWLPVGA